MMDSAMKNFKLALFAILLAATSYAGGLALCGSAHAGEGLFDGWSLFSDHPKSRNYRRVKPQVRGYRRRVGGYSYGAHDSAGTGFLLPKQDGPFDSGFFFDSNFGAPGDAPYNH